MKERPILFSAPMVRAILAGLKTQTRRVVKPTPEEAGFGRNCDIGPYCTGTDWPLAYYERRGACWNSSKPLQCKYGQPGDRLWVKETWCCKMDCGEFLYRPDGHHDCYYAATETEHIIKDDGDGGTSYRRDGTEASPWVSSLYMPRWASRITLEITGIRVERLNRISEADALAEGIDTTEPFKVPYRGQYMATPELRYAYLWEQINGKGSWDKNPWVWVIQFKTT